MVSRWLCSDIGILTVYVSVQRKCRPSLRGQCIDREICIYSVQKHKQSVSRLLPGLTAYQTKNIDFVCFIFHLMVLKINRFFRPMSFRNILVIFNRKWSKMSRTKWRPLKLWKTIYIYLLIEKCKWVSASRFFIAFWVL